MVEDHNELEKKVLKILYNNIHELESSRINQDGQSKIQLLSIYSFYKIMIDREEQQMVK